MPSLHLPTGLGSSSGCGCPGTQAASVTPLYISSSGSNHSYLSKGEEVVAIHDPDSTLVTGEVLVSRDFLNLMVPAVATATLEGPAIPGSLGHRKPGL